MARGIEIERDRQNVLVLNYTRRCPLACDFCCYSCGPRHAETMDVELALDLVDQAAGLGVFAELSFTGGEPFESYDDILRISARTAEHGMPFSIISAGAWATDEHEVDRLLRPLIANGMTSLAVSHDPSHERWVSRDQIRGVVRRAVALGLDTSVIGTFHDAETRLEDLFPEFADDADVSLHSTLVAPDVGRMTHKPSRTRALRAQIDGSFADTCYKRVYHDVTVFWDGEVYPCCSVYNRQTPGISYGNVYSTPLWQIWDRIEASLFLRTIKHHGFTDLYRLIERLDPDLAGILPDPASAMGARHLRRQMISDPDISTRVHEVLDREARCVGSSAFSCSEGQGAKHRPVAPDTDLEPLG